MKILKGMTAGVLCLTMLSAPAIGTLNTNEVYQVEASVQTKAMYAKKEVDAYTSRNSKTKKVMTIPYGVRIDRLAVHSSWSQIRYKGKIGWVASRDLVEIKKVEVLDTKQTVKMYSSRSTKGKLITKIPATKQVTRVAINKSWSQVKYGNHIGWVASSQLKSRYTKETFALKKYRVKEAVPLQATASSSSRIVSTLPEFAAVESVEKYNNWYKVTFDKRTGWVQAKYLTTFKVETLREALDRIYVDGYETWTQKGAAGSSKFIDENLVEFYYRDGHSTLEYDENLEEPLAREEHNKAAKLITSQHGGDPYELATKMWHALQEGGEDQEDLIYSKYRIYKYSNKVTIEWN